MVDMPPTLALEQCAGLPPSNRNVLCRSKASLQNRGIKAAYSDVDFYLGGGVAFFATQHLVCLKAAMK